MAESLKPHVNESLGSEILRVPFDPANDLLPVSEEISIGTNKSADGNVHVQMTRISILIKPFRYEIL